MPRRRIAAPALEIRLLGVDIRRPQEHRIDRPHGTGDWLFLHFHTPITIRDTAGLRTVPAGACVLYEPGRPQWYHGTGPGYAIDYCHFAGRDARALARRYRIPLNRAVVPARPQPFDPLMRALALEFLRRDAHWADVCPLLLTQILVALGRSATAEEAAELTPRQADLAERLRDLRMRMHQELKSRWTLPAMAGLVHLSASRFSHVYRQFFGRSPMNDLIDARVAHACWLLASEPMAVKQVSGECGFADVHYFSRVFRARVGCAPQAYARRRKTPGARRGPEEPLENIRKA
jgi:AraC family transcriptional regulator, arabinose operon regulatory protein